MLYEYRKISFFTILAVDKYLGNPLFQAHMNKNMTHA